MTELRNKRYAPAHRASRPAPFIWEHGPVARILRCFGGTSLPCRLPPASGRDNEPPYRCNPLFFHSPTAREEQAL